LMCVSGLIAEGDFDWLHFAVSCAGNGILDERELRVGLAQLGVDVSNDSMVLSMMMEADIDGNNGIDFGEFKDVIFRVLDGDSHLLLLLLYFFFPPPYCSPLSPPPLPAHSPFPFSPASSRNATSRNVSPQMAEE
jgi:hypothetical protein